MTHDDIIRMAREAADPDAVDPLCGSDWGDLITLDLDEMVRFAALVAAEKDKEIAELQTSLRICKSSEERAQAYLEVAKKMRDESRPDVLESERAANAKLTEELEKSELLVDEKLKEIAVLQKALDAALDFAGTVAGGSSWWEEIWAEHEAAIDAARGEK